MAARLDITATLFEQGGNRTVLRRFVLLFCAAMVWVGLGDARAQQQGYWTYDTAFEFAKPFVIDPQVAFDRWGNRHYAWVTYDPNSSGYQAFYTNDATGAVGAPFLATDIGTLYYDSVGVDSSMIFLLDRNANSHFLFLANVLEPNGFELGLYYSNNRGREFLDGNPLLLTNQSGRYDMAIDSNNTAHVIWLEESVAGPIEVWYWNSNRPAGGKRKVDEIPCAAGDCRFSDPQVEAHGDRLEVFVRVDPGTVYRMVINSDGTTVAPAALPLPLYDPQIVSKGASDLHMRAAVDVSGAFHLLLPCWQTNARPQLLYVSNSSGSTTILPLITIDSSLRGFDIATDGRDKLAAVWTIHRGRFTADRPMTGVAEFRRNGVGAWQEIARITDLNTVAGNSELEWRGANRVAIFGDRLTINGQRFKVGFRGDTTEFRMGAFVRHSVQPQTAYILPDAGAPSMSVVVETFAPPHAFNSFGHDTLDPESVGLELVNPADSNRIVIGPSVVSWSGRLVSTMIFIRPDALPGDVPVRVRVGSAVSNQQIFHVVTPQRLGVDGSGRLTGGGTLGSGGIYGVRSPRGVLVVDTLILADGIYNAWYKDVDPSFEGNQGMLPLTILARGPVIVDSNAILSVSAPISAPIEEYGAAGPGGGGGGAGMAEGGGPGFTAGGGPSERIGENGYDGRRQGSGGEYSGRYVAGGSIGGAHGGAARPGVPSGGGTGHPFGASGRYGRGDSLSPTAPDNGGFGAGTAGNLDGNYSTGGGGGGYAASGTPGGIARNGGRTVGSTVLIPLAGGSGGGGAYSINGLASGGGGGGGIALYSYREIHLLGEIRADGGDGHTDGNSAVASGGGGGSGGGVLIGAQDRLLIGPQGKISAAGGKGGEMRGGANFVSAGGDGSDGRIRLDGRIDYRDSVIQFAYPMPGYYGPSTGMNGSFRALGNDTIAGTGIPGNRVRVYVRPRSSAWLYDTPKETTVDTAGEWSVSLTPQEAVGGLVYAVAMQEVEDPSSNPRTARPRWVMSTAAGNIVGRPAAQFSAENLDFGCVPYPECRTLDVVIINTGEQSDLQIYSISLSGSDWFSRVAQDALLRIRPGESRTIQIRFCPEDTGNVTASLRLLTNLYPEVQTIELSGCGISGRLDFDQDTIDIGELCPGMCRDTTITLVNEGSALLRVNEIVADEKGITLELLDASLPIEILPGQSRKVRVRACLKAGDGNISVGFRAVLPPSIRPQGLTLRVRNMGAQPELPDSVFFDVRDLGKGDTCRLDTFLLKNRSARNTMTIEDLVVEGDGFGVLSPAPGTQIPPNGTVPVLLRFCTDQPGTYSGQLRLSFGSGDCALDTVVALSGSVVLSLPNLQIEGREPDENISIFFGSVPLGISSAPRDIVLYNIGAGLAKGVTYEFLSGAGEFTVTLSQGDPVPFTLPGTRRRTFTINATPSDTGIRQGILRIASEDGWSRDIALSVNGVKSAIVPDTLYLDFGDVRKGNTAYRDLRILNKGSLVDDVVGFEIDDSTNFFLTSSSVPIPTTLRPGEGMTTTLRFTPLGEGAISDVLHIRTRENAAATIPVLLTGRGLYEKAEADLVRLEFNCDTLTKTFLVRNTGTWPLKIDKLELVGRNPERFRLPDQPAPDIVEPGGSKVYRVEYIPGPTEARAAVAVSHSSGQLLIDLQGALCEDELMLLTFSMSYLEGTVGSIVSVPVEFLVNRPVTEDIPFRLQLLYEWSLLVPESAVFGQKTAGGEVAENVEIEEIEPGEMIIEGVIPEGTESGTLLEIPMRVLLGRTYRTELWLDKAQPDALPAHYRVQFDSGSFRALDCDTLGTIDISGRYAIKQNTPNPFNAETTIRFEIARREHVRIVLYDAAGNAIGTLLDQLLDRGEHHVVIKPGTFPAGLYFYEITSGRFKAARSMLIVE